MILPKGGKRYRKIGRLFVTGMMLTGRPMKGYVFIDPEGYDLEEDLLFWLDHCISFNPKANAAKNEKNEIIPYPIESY